MKWISLFISEQIWFYSHHFIPDLLSKCNECVKAIVLVDLNEFPSIFQKVQHCHSRHQKQPQTSLKSN